MIRNECFRRDWIEAKRNELGVVDAVLLEKCIHALQLLGMLATTGLDFVFKGGTSMILLLKRIRRLSSTLTLPPRFRMPGVWAFFRFSRKIHRLYVLTPMTEASTVCLAANTSSSTICPPSQTVKITLCLMFFRKGISIPSPNDNGSMHRLSRLIKTLTWSCRRLMPFSPTSLPPSHLIRLA